MSLSLFSRTLIAALLAAATLGAQQPAAKRSRNLEFVGEEEIRQAAEQKGFAVPRSYALVVGVGQYRNLPKDKWLEFAEPDAEALYSILISPEGGNFRAENVRRLVGPEATLGNIKDALEKWLPAEAGPADRVLVYFAGHGFVDEGHAFLAPYDLDPDDVARSGYPMDRLGSVIGGQIGASNKIILTDSCHSGAITPRADPNANQTVNQSLLALDASVFSLTASRDRESSFEGREWGEGHGVFTYYLVRGLEGEADANGNGVVVADELAEYVRYNVRRATDGRQTPTSDRGSFDPLMPLAYVPEILIERPPVAEAQFGSFVFETNQDGVEVFIDGRSRGVVNRDRPLELDGFRPGPHTVKAVKQGYEPDGPREEMIYPGQRKTVTIRILYTRRRPQAALDEMDRGVELYQRGFAKNYRKAAARFRAALAIDPNYSEASVYLARAQSALFDYDAARRGFERALEIDPDYLEARSAFAGALLDTGDFDQAILQLNRVLRRDPEYALAHAMLAQAYRMKELYPDAIQSARQAIRLNPHNAEPYLFLADALRLSGRPAEAEPQYREFLERSDFQSSRAGEVFNFWVRGFLIGGGKRTRASSRDIWEDLRGLAYFGLADALRLEGRFEAAVEQYQQALSYDAEDPLIYWGLGLAYYDQAKANGSRDVLVESRRSFCKLIELNPFLGQAEKARKAVDQMDSLLRADGVAPAGSCGAPAGN